MFNILRPWLVQATDGTNVIEAHPNAPAPDGPYISVNLIHSENTNLPMGFNYEEDPTAPVFPPYATGETPTPTGYDPLFQVPVFEAEWTYSVNIYAPNALDLGRKIQLWAVSDAADLLLYPLSTQPVKRVSRMPVYMDGTWEGRAQLDLAVRGVVQNGTLIDENGQKVIVGRVPLNEIITGTIVIGPYEDPDFASIDYEKPLGDD